MVRIKLTSGAWGRRDKLWAEPEFSAGSRGCWKDQGDAVAAGMQLTGHLMGKEPMSMVLQMPSFIPTVPSHPPLLTPSRDA